MNKALSLTTSATGYRYDAMEAPSSPATTNFTTAMTMALSVQVQPGGVTTGTTDVFMPIVQKEEYEGGFSYLLGTDFPSPISLPTAAIATTTKSYLLQPPTGQFILTEGQWYHLALTYDSAAGVNNFKLYVNGMLAGQTTATGPLATGDGPLLHRAVWQLGGGRLSLWNRALAQSEIASILTAPLKGTESGLALYYNFNDTTQALNNPECERCPPVPGELHTEHGSGGRCGPGNHRHFDYQRRLRDDPVERAVERLLELARWSGCATPWIAQHTRVEASSGAGPIGLLQPRPNCSLHSSHARG